MRLAYTPSRLLAFLIIAIAPSHVHAQGWIDRVQKVSSHVTVNVTGRVATVEVEEQFRNNGGALGQADYMYPLPGEAVFSNFSLYQGDQELRGETMDANRARSIYEAIVRAKRDPALIELAGHGLLRARVFPIAAGETRKISLRYTQVLTRSGDALQFKYATTPQTSATPTTFRLLVEEGARFGEPFSPTHDVNVSRTGNRVTVTPIGSFTGDFDIFMPLRSTTASVTVATHRPSSEDGFFMLTLSPANARETVTPRDITAVVDVSGSMSGEKIVQARAALHSLLSSLSNRDRFRLISFSDQVRVLETSWMQATRENLDRGNQWIDNLVASGGTNISGALNEAFHATSPAERLPFVVFITDGLPSIGEQNPERIAQMAEQQRGRTRVFAFGVGYDVNTYLLDRLSAAARGTTQYVKPGESVERAVGTLAGKIRFPVLTDLRFGDTPVRITDVYPRQLPDLFSGEELIVVGRYSGSGNGVVAVRGNRSGSTETVTGNAEFHDHELGNEFIPKLWAARKVGFLTQQLKLNGYNAELADELRETAMRYGILSEYTSYLVQEPNSPPHGVAFQSTGAGAVGNAVRDQARREAKSLAMAAPTAAEVAQIVVAEKPVRPGVDVVSIQPFSDAYFTLLKALPELKTYWRASDKGTVDGKRVRIKLAADGVTQLDASRVASIVKQFRT
jgi:Ca-activated chloride channel family protein